MWFLLDLDPTELSNPFYHPALPSLFTYPATAGVAGEGQAVLLF